MRDSPISKYLVNINTNLFRCPTDRRFKEREPQFIYPFNYSLSSGYHSGYGVSSNPGMASQFQWAFQKENGKFKVKMIRNPSDKIMLAEDVSRSDLSAGEQGGLSRFLTSGFLWNHGDRLSRRHNGRANVIFLDGRAETVRQSFGDQREHTDPTK